MTPRRDAGRGQWGISVPGDSSDAGRMTAGGTWTANARELSEDIGSRSLEHCYASAQQSTASGTRIEIPKGAARTSGTALSYRLERREREQPMLLVHLDAMWLCTDSAARPLIMIFKLKYAHEENTAVAGEVLSTGSSRTVRRRRARYSQVRAAPSTSTSIHLANGRISTRRARYSIVRAAPSTSRRSHFGEESAVLDSTSCFLTRRTTKTRSIRGCPSFGPPRSLNSLCSFELDIDCAVWQRFTPETLVDQVFCVEFREEKNPPQNNPSLPRNVQQSNRRRTGNARVDACVCRAGGGEDGVKSGAGQLHPHEDASPALSSITSSACRATPLSLTQEDEQTDFEEYSPARRHRIPAGLYALTALAKRSCPSLSHGGRSRTRRSCYSWWIFVMSAGDLAGSCCFMRWEGVESMHFPSTIFRELSAVTGASCTRTQPLETHDRQARMGARCRAPPLPRVNVQKGSEQTTDKPTFCSMAEPDLTRGSPGLA
ncbi:hypothetical protein DFH06DRAFT_1132110 [Mycena polygramma]|nr:hypothetical protein DFH06DRAFT_1132110 [Mycena polygramma]